MATVAVRAHQHEDDPDNPQFPHLGGQTLALSRPRDYCRWMIVAAAVAGLVVFVAVSLALAARLVHLGNLDALALA
jgi:hypothetical protein